MMGKSCSQEDYEYCEDMALAAIYQAAMNFSFQKSVFINMFAAIVNKDNKIQLKINA